VLQLHDIESEDNGLLRSVHSTAEAQTNALFHRHVSKERIDLARQKLSASLASTWRSGVSGRSTFGPLPETPKLPGAGI
jgi:hypothetical protein